MKASKKTDTEAVVPNGTDLPLGQQRVNELVKQYNELGKASVQNFVKKCETLVEVSELFEYQQQDFCKAVKLEYGDSKSKSSMYRKHLKIGQEASRFEPFFEQLPNHWTTLYKLAMLDKVQFDLVAKDDRFAPTMTAAEVDLILAGGSDNNANRLPTDCAINFEAVESSKKEEVYSKLVSLAEEYGFKCRFSSKFDKLVPPAPKPLKRSFFEYVRDKRAA